MRRPYERTEMEDGFQTRPYTADRVARIALAQAGADVPRMLLRKSRSRRCCRQQRSPGRSSRAASGEVAAPSVFAEGPAHLLLSSQPDHEMQRLLHRFLLGGPTAGLLGLCHQRIVDVDIDAHAGSYPCVSDCYHTREDRKNGAGCTRPGHKASCPGRGTPAF